MIVILLGSDDAAAWAAQGARAEEDVFPLTKDPSFFTGKKPSAVIFPDGSRLPAASWKSVVELVLQDCIRDQERKKSLMKLWNQICGTKRIILGSSCRGMRRPIRLGRNLYVRAEYSTRDLLRLLSQRILPAVGCDCGGIQVAVRRR